MWENSIEMPNREFHEVWGDKDVTDSHIRKRLFVKLLNHCSQHAPAMHLHARRPMPESVFWGCFAAFVSARLCAATYLYGACAPLQHPSSVQRSRPETQIPLQDCNCTIPFTHTHTPLILLCSSQVLVYAVWTVNFALRTESDASVPQTADWDHFDSCNLC